MSSPRILVLGGRPVCRAGSNALGWHLGELQSAATRQGAELFFADYESLTGQTDAQITYSTALCENVHVEHAMLMRLDEFDAILTRTMPPGGTEQIVFRLAVMHDEYYRRSRAGGAASFINPPAALELAIDKYATLTRAARMGILTPATIVTQSRSEAMQAFDRLGGDVVVKPIFGGEGRGVMRIRDAELAWTTFSTLQQLGSVFYVQQFCGAAVDARTGDRTGLGGSVGLGGSDVRLLVIGPHIHAIRRTSESDFRTNVRAGGRSEVVPLTEAWRELAERVCREFGLTFAAVDLIETNHSGDVRLMEVNAIPGWKSAQTAIKESIAEQIISVFQNAVCHDSALPSSALPNSARQSKTA